MILNKSKIKLLNLKIINKQSKTIIINILKILILSHFYVMVVAKNWHLNLKQLDGNEKNIIYIYMDIIILLNYFIFLLFLFYNNHFKFCFH